MADRELGGIDPFVKLLTAQQRPLFVYIYSLVGEEAGASDILQNTNEVLWSKRAEFTPGSSFAAWASRIAYFQVMDHCKRRKTDRHLFDSELLGQVADAVTEVAQSTDHRLQYLDECLGELPAKQRTLVRQRYEPGVSVTDLAQQQGSTTAAVSQLLYRIRQRLMDCIEAKLVGEARK